MLFQNLSDKDGEFSGIWVVVLPVDHNVARMCVGEFGILLEQEYNENEDGIDTGCDDL